MTKHNNGTITTIFPSQEMIINYGNGTIISGSGSNFPAKTEVTKVDPITNIRTTETKFKSANLGVAGDYILNTVRSVSYTHLTLPTIRLV